MYNKGISKAVINRLPRYHRYLGMLMDKGVVRISSAGLSRQMNVTASQIRQDLNLFGGSYDKRSPLEALRREDDGKTV